MKNISAVVSDVVKERMKNTFLGNFIISWVLVNHALILYFIFSGDDANKKLNKLDLLELSILTDLVYPLLLVILYLYILPLINLALLSVKLRFIEPLLSKYKNGEQELLLDAKLEIEDKRLDLSFREKEREVNIEQKKSEWQKQQSLSVEVEANAAKKRQEAEQKEAEFTAIKLKNLEKIIKLEDILEREKLINNRENDLRKRQQFFEDKLHEFDYQRHSAQWVVLDKETATGDRVTLDFEGSINGEIFEGGKAESFSIEVGSGRMIPGFEDGLLGRRSGDKFNIPVKFPDDYHAENLKGKSAQFDIAIHKVESLMVPISEQKS
ncbi:FKBP-type peptidyl-prolyl cis-trans isomerase [Pseudoalteromonas sp. SG43-4]|uniref:FKBP-type peptidyl-prolyl cis-trans isomerase n=1 Tax=Pseudoalteromonas sp. SG43-4 TaxID=2760969 RepID=UPI002175A8EA